MTLDNKTYLKIVGKDVINNVFSYLLILFLFTLLLREFFKNYVDHYININIFMIIVIIFGVLAVLTYKEQERVIRQSKPKRRDYFLIWFLGLAGMVLIFLKIKNLGWISYFISVLGGIIIIMLSYLLLKDEQP